MLVGGFLLLIVGLAVGALIAIYVGIHTNLRELAMLFGIGGWPGRMAAVQAILWIVIIFMMGPPPDGWVFYAVVLMLLSGTLAIPFYVNNRPLLRTVRAHEEPVAPEERVKDQPSLLPCSGQVVVSPDSDDDQDHLEPVVAPFTSTACAAYEWAVQRKQRLSRRRAYTTIDAGEEAGTFDIVTDGGTVTVAPEDPTLLLVYGVGITGYETTTNKPSPSDATTTAQNPISSAFSGEMRYCETTVTDGDAITVIGPVTDTASPADHSFTLADTGDEPLFIINAEYKRLKRAVDQYLRWTPHIGALGLLGSWGYAVFLLLA